MDLSRGVPAQRAVRQRRAAEVGVVHPTAILFGRVACERAVDQRRAAAVVVVHPAAGAGRVSRERTVGQGRAAGFVVHPAAADAGRVAREHTVGQGRAATVVVHPAAAIGAFVVTVLNQQILEDGVGRFTGTALEQPDPATTVDDRGRSTRRIDRTPDRDRLATRIDRPRREVDSRLHQHHVSVTRGLDCILDPGVFRWHQERHRPIRDALVRRTVPVRIVTGICQTVSAEIREAPGDVLGIVAAQGAVRQRRAAGGGAVHPAAIVGRVAREGAIGQRRAAVFLVVHPAAIFNGGVSREHAVGQRRAAAIVVEHPPAVLGRVVRERACGQGQAAGTVEHPAAIIFDRVACERAVGQGRAATRLIEHPPAVAGRVARERAVDQRRAAVVVVHPAAGRIRSVLDHEPLEHRRLGLAVATDQHAVRPRTIQHARRLTRLVQHPPQGDRLAERVDLLALEVRLRRELDHVTIVRRIDRRVDEGVVTPVGTHGDRLGRDGRARAGQGRGGEQRSVQVVHRGGVQSLKGCSRLAEHAGHGISPDGICSRYHESPTKIREPWFPIAIGRRRIPTGPINTQTTP